VLPKVEDLIPETIALGSIISLAGGLGVLSFGLATLLRLSDAERDSWTRWGTATGLGMGSAFYLMALLVQVLCRQ
jgi:hypothetical protein